MIHEVIELYKTWQKILPHFPSNSRHTLGFRIDTLFIEIAESLFISSFLNSQRKFLAIQRISSDLDSAKFLLRLAWEIKSINEPKYILLSEYTNKIGKQIGGWLKELQSKLPNLGEK